ncbi:MAG TPA: hypothetical protein VFY71_05065 [Planctomycetota bacterium]|nr:hypothetical protein [Planctomycetota bacterium]
MAKEKDTAAETMSDMKPSKAKRAVKAGVVLAAAGLTALAISRRMKSRKGKAASKKTSRAKAGRKTRSGARSTTRRSSGARRTSRSR